jgi:hypothetical protein
LLLVKSGREGNRGENKRVTKRRVEEGREGREGAGDRGSGRGEEKE